MIKVFLAFFLFLTFTHATNEIDNDKAKKPAVTAETKLGELFFRFADMRIQLTTPHEERLMDEELKKKCMAIINGNVTIMVDDYGNAFIKDN